MAPAVVGLANPNAVMAFAEVAAPAVVPTGAASFATRQPAKRAFTINTAKKSCNEDFMRSLLIANCIIKQLNKLIAMERLRRISGQIVDETVLNHTLMVMNTQCLSVSS
jgi:hypothetical protein